MCSAKSPEPHEEEGRNTTWLNTALVPPLYSAPYLSASALVSTRQLPSNCPRQSSEGVELF